MTLQRFVLSLLVASFASVPDAAAQAGDYPAKPVRVIVPYGAGGASDIIPRTIMAKLSETWGKPIVVENRAGGNGVIGMDAAAKAAADGYTLVSAPVANVAINPHMFPNLPFDVSRDLVPVTLMGNVQNVLVVHPSVGVNTVQELVGKARANPGKLSYASIGAGSIPHLAAELLQGQAGISLLHVPYQAVGLLVTNLVGGQTDLAFAQMPSALPHVRAGKLKALGLAGTTRSPLLPELPTLDELGFRGVHASSWYALMAPAGTPPDIIAKLHADIAATLKLADVRSRLEGLGVEGGGNTPAETSALIRADYARYGELVRRLKLKPE